MTLETEPQRYQCWLAVDRGSSPSAASLRWLAAPQQGIGVCDYGRLAGSINVSKRSRQADSGFHRVRLTEASTGILSTKPQLESKGVPYLTQSVIY
jgi:hypothetical protein